MPDNVSEGSQDKTVEQGDKGHPESVSWTEHVGVKEMLKKREESLTTETQAKEEAQKTLETSKTHMTELETEVKNLGERLKAGVDPVEFKRINEELDKRKTQELEAVRTVLTKAGFTEEDLKDMSPENLALLVKGAEKGQVKKPGADLGTGGGSQTPTSARAGMKAAFDEMHPSDK